ncbi:Eco57I restriction-modification methylase domain-containing protein [Hymenobacter algoricola]|uniref:site-specific DNA-methyltransferase (adenine-specific) n=1 Tax=Hymenobacter algoricola TaxID=486267 RepID=A0ABP7MP88_9BACT
MPELLPLFPAAALPAPFTNFQPATALPDFAGRVTHLRRWQQAIKDGYVRSRKEEALQAEFLNLLFGQVLGYEYQNTTHRQLELELKTLTDGTKPDGALGDFVSVPSGGLAGPVRAVVELKDARTGLDAKQRRSTGGRAETPVEQAFSYPSKYGATCRWVLASNFVELRLYAANDQLRAEVFNLETLPDDEAQLRRFFALLLPAHLLPAPGRAEAPLDEALQQRQQEEVRITKSFYKDYSTARRQLLDHLIEQNPAVPPLDLLAHTQKLLDRVIFVCFCEDKNIIPRLTFRRLLDAVRQNVFDPADDKVYRTVRGLFQSIDQGNPLAGINRFNGGLFAEDPALDSLTIKDRTLTPVIQLEQYDFASDLNVNILGHIFEQSLSDLEAERARLSGQAHDPKQGKRKQDGIFYTPEYITRYIVRQAVGGWLLERRREAGLEQLPELTDDDRATIRLGTGNKLVQPSARVQKHLAAWETYATALEGIRVLDPACGSGAFLNEAFGYLLREGEQVNRELAALRAGQFKVFDLDRHILQHNLYGVDLNPESVDITRLSLWLQTANPGKPLTSLDHSIRCGNSLISDPAVAGPRAFDWPTAFPEVFAQGGFDVVIGNPPYVSNWTLSENNRHDVEYLEKTYKKFLVGHWDLYTCFIALSFNLMNEEGYNSFILPTSFLKEKYNKAIRESILKDHQLLEIVDFGENIIFENVARQTCIYIAKKKHQKENSIIIKLDSFENSINGKETRIDQSFFNQLKNTSFKTNVSNADIELYKKLHSNSALLGELACINTGVVAHAKIGSPVAFKKDDVIHKEYSPGFKKYVTGTNLSRYSLIDDGSFIDYDSKKDFFHRPKYKLLFESEKIIVRRISGNNNRIYAYFDNEHVYSNDNLMHMILWNDNVLSFQKPENKWNVIKESNIYLKYILTIISSKLITYYFTKFLSTDTLQGSYSSIYPEDLRQFPIPNIPPAEQQPFITAAETLLAGHKELHEADAKTARLIRAELGLSQPLSGKLALTQPWPTWSTALEKALGRKLSLPEKSTWLDYLTQFQQQQQQRRDALQRQDTALDALVYQLYQLTPAEIALVEGRPAPAG